MDQYYRPIDSTSLFWPNRNVQHVKMGKWEQKYEAGALKPPIVSGKYPLSEATQAYRRVASGKSGKVVLLMRGRDVPQETNAVQSEALETT